MRVMKRPRSKAFPAKQEASHARSAKIGKVAVDKDKPRTNVAFIGCPEDTRKFAISRDRPQFLQAVTNAVEVGADIIYIIFQATASINAALVDSLVRELTLILDDAWGRSVEQPAYYYKGIGSVMSFYSISRVSLLSQEILDPEAGLPAIVHTFNTPEGRLCIVTASLPTLPRITRGRLLEAYATATANSKADTALIGAVCADKILFMENQIAKLKVDYELFTNENLLLLTHCSNGTSAQCIALDTDAPFSLIALLDRTASCPDSAERPVPRDDAITLRPATPLYDRLIAELENATKQQSRGHEFIEYITRQCFYGSLCTKTFFGEKLEKPMPVAVKMEELLKAAQRQRQRFLGRISQMDRHIRIGEGNMREIFNEWRHHPEEWMNPKSLEHHENMLWNGQEHKAQQYAKSCFSTFTFQISGCKFLLHKLIQLPIISELSLRSVEQPVPRQPAATVLMELLNSYEEHKTTTEYLEAVKSSQKNQKCQMRLSQELWWAQYYYTRGRSLATKVQDGMLNYFELNSEDQNLVEAFENRQSAKKLDRLLEQKRAPCRGAGTEVNH